MATFGDDSLPPSMRLVGVRGEDITLFTRYITGTPTSFIGVGAGAKGLDAPDFDVQTDAFPTLDGEFIRFARSTGREIMLPIIIYGNSRREMILKKRELLSALNPKIGTVQLVTAELDSALTSYDDVPTFEDERQIELYYSHGFEGDEGRNSAGLNWTRFGLVLRATYPFFKGLEVLRFPFTGAAADPVSFFAQPPPPGDGPWGERVFRLSQEIPFVDAITIDNPGDVEDYPTWTIVGPIAGPFDLVLLSSDGFSDQVLSITEELVLTEGQRVVITTAPGAQGVSSIYGYGFEIFNSNPNFWALQPGLNSVEIRATGGQSLNPAYVEVSFSPTFMGL